MIYHPLYFQFILYREKRRLKAVVQEQPMLETHFQHRLDTHTMKMTEIREPQNPNRQHR
ncbi:hypothetical protein AZ013_004285 [Citrobacter freundii]|nr:hypothetical protein AZ013_004285 [Citrobacter freundii]